MRWYVNFANVYTNYKVISISIVNFRMWKLLVSNRTRNSHQRNLQMLSDAKAQSFITFQEISIWFGITLFFWQFSPVCLHFVVWLLLSGRLTCQSTFVHTIHGSLLLFVTITRCCVFRDCLLMHQYQCLIITHTCEKRTTGLGQGRCKSFA